MNKTVDRGRVSWSCELCGHRNASTSVKCVNCDAPNPKSMENDSGSSDFSSAKERGVDPAKSCATCGKSNEASAKFCSGCGARFGLSDKPVAGASTKTTAASTLGLAEGGRTELRRSAWSRKRPVAPWGFALAPFLANTAVILTAHFAGLWISIGLAIALTIGAYTHSRSTALTRLLVLSATVAIASTIAAHTFLRGTGPVALVLVNIAIIAVMNWALKTSGILPRDPPQGNADDSPTAVIPGGAVPQSSVAVTNEIREDGVKNPTGVVSHGERSITASGQPPPGSAGVVQHIDDKSILRFRVTVASSQAGQVAQFHISSNLDRNDAYVQEGDVITVIGTFIPDQQIVDPLIVNHTSQTAALPASPSHWAPAIVAILIVAYGLGYFVAARPSMTFSGPIPYFLFLAFLIFGPIVAVWWAVRTLYRNIRLGMARKSFGPFTAAWARRNYNNPQGVVEGLLTFTRKKWSVLTGRYEPWEWTIFRISIHDPQGESVDRMTWAVESRQVPSTLRRGDTVSVEGDWATGRINRTDHVSIL